MIVSLKEVFQELKDDRKTIQTVIAKREKEHKEQLEKGKSNRSPAN